MKHAYIVTELDKKPKKKYIEFSLTDVRTVYLAETEYTEDELEEFNSVQSKWILRRQGDRTFLADHDSGEDATGYYCGYFDLVPERAVFDNGKFVGMYLCNGGITYYGNDRASFYIERWGYPGDDPFKFISYGNKQHVFLFLEPDTLEWGEWSLMERDPEAEYENYLEF